MQRRFQFSARGRNVLSGCFTVVAAVFVLAGCSSSSSTTSNANGGSSKAGTNSAGVQKAEATIAHYSQPYNGIGVTVPLKQLPKGKTFFYLPCPSEVCIVDSVNAMKAAAKAMGARLTVMPEGATPATITSAWDSAASASPAPAGLFWGGVPPQVMQHQISTLAGKKVPMIAWGAGLVNAPTGGTNWPGVSLDVAPISWGDRNGQLMADWIVADSKGNANTLFVNFPDYALFNHELAAFKNEYNALCSTCQFSSIPAKATDFGTKLPGQVVSALQRNPKINYIVFAYGDMVLGVPEALATAGLATQVKIVSQSGGKKNYEYIQKGQQAVDVAFDNSFIGWKSMDALARLSAGESAAPDTGPLPTRFLTKANLQLDPSTGEAVVAPDYQKKFEALWGVNGG